MMDVAVDFSTSSRIIFGPASLNKLPELLDGLGGRALFLQIKGLRAIHIVTNFLNEKKINILNVEESGEPEVNKINRITQQAREFACDFVIGLGGGSVLDAGKAVAAMLANEGELSDYLEVVGAGKSIKNPSLPFIAIPTTAGTGSEVTRNAVISVPEKQVKVSMRHNFLLPSIALVDPELTYSLPPELTAFTGMDALTQVIEPYISTGRNLMVDMFCRDAIQKAGVYLRRAYSDGSDQEARINMSWVSLMGGLSLANAKLGVVHGLAGPMGGMFNLPHGLLCAALLHAALFVNYQLIRTEAGASPVLSRLDEIAGWLTGRSDAEACDGVDWIRTLTDDLKIPRLSEMGVVKSRFPEIIEKSKNSSSMKGNPIPLDEAHILRILEMSF